MKIIIQTSIILFLVMISTAGIAQNTRITHINDWSVYKAENPTQCWMGSTPKKTVNSKNGKPVSNVKRGDIFLFVSYVPDKKINGEISFTSGYPLQPDTVVKLTIGKKTFDMIPDGEYAFPLNNEQERQMRLAMMKGSKAIIKGKSIRGTDTEDSFSLMGFTLALKDTKKRCNIP